ncbi:MAG: hypothetical protein Q9171_002698 [Xanthocarpia ochracea]
MDTDHHRQHIQTLLFPFGILDLRFCPYKPLVFALATSVGTVRFGYLTPDPDLFAEVMSSYSTIKVLDHPIVVADPETCITSLDFAPPHKQEKAIAVTMSNGSIAVFNLKPPIVKSILPAAHILMETPIQAWAVAWSLRIPDPALYTGGDDTVLRRHRVKEEVAGGAAFHVLPEWHDSFECDAVIHDCGVTAIIPLWIDKDGNEVILTGSYDEYIRILYIRPDGKSAKLVASGRLHGGVWQLKLLERLSDPEDPAGFSFPVLASCMQAGCKIIKVHRYEGDNWAIEILAEFMDPGSKQPLNYASDFQVGLQSERFQDMTYLSTNFDDKRLCVWTLDDEDTGSEPVCTIT